MNLAEPSGSSPPEKPPGIMTIWLARMRRASSWVLSATASGVRLLITKVSASAPAARKARALSYSQLLPGNTGMITRGRAILAPPYTWMSLARKSMVSTSGVSPALR